MSVALKSTIIDGLSVEIGHCGVSGCPSNCGVWCSVKLLPYKHFLFSAELEWLAVAGTLEDGDATHVVEPATIAKILEWAKENDYVLAY